jgi:hypothetical protein
MDILIQEIEDLKNLFSLFFVMRVLLFILILFFVANFLLRLFSYFDEKFYNKRISSGGTYLFIINFLPILLIFVTIYWFFLQNRLLLFAFALISLFIFASLFTKAFISFYKITPLVIRGKLSKGKIIVILNKRLIIERVGLFHTTCFDSVGALEVIPTSRFIENEFSISDHVPDALLSVVVMSKKSLDSKSLGMIKRILLTKPYVNSGVSVEIVQESDQIKVTLGLISSSFEKYAKIDIRKTCEQVFNPVNK